ncbi:hypothetical protein QOT17_020523 [Balamuthia mandrillaris]
MGGTLSNATAVLMFPELPTDPSYLEAATKYNSLIRVTGRATNNCAPGHKVDIFKLAELAAFKFVIMMDCDTVILRDITPELMAMTCDSFYASPAESPIQKTTSAHILQYAKAALAIPMPWHNQEPRCKHISSSPTTQKRLQVQPEEFPYFNAGVIILPQTLFKPITRLWHFYNDFMASIGESWFCDQASLSLTLAALDAPYNFLPSALNVAYELLPTEDLGDVAVLHYHSTEGTRAGEMPLVNVPGKTRDNVAAYNAMVRQHPDPYLSVL